MRLDNTEEEARKAIADSLKGGRDMSHEIHNVLLY
jgi:hypothetical protein